MNVPIHNGPVCVACIDLLRMCIFTNANLSRGMSVSVTPKYIILIVIVQVAANGYFTLYKTTPYIGYQPSPFHGTMSLIAPFFLDTDISRGTGRVVYEIHTDTSGEVISQVNSFINERKQTQFYGQWLMIASWFEVPQYNKTDKVRLILKSCI